jgi:hypothetical protein
LQENYEFLTNQNQTISLHTFDNEHIGTYKAHLLVNIDGWSATAPLVYEFEVEVLPCDALNIQFENYVEPILMYRNHTETR